MANPTIVHTAVAHAATADGTPSINLPSGILDNDLAVISIHSPNTARTITPPSGFKEVEQPSSINANAFKVYYKYLASTDSSTTLTAAISGSGLIWGMALTVLRGATIGIVTSSATSTNDTSPPVAGFTPASDDMLWLVMGDYTSNTITYTQPSGFTLDVSSGDARASGTHVTMYIAHKQLTGQKASPQSGVNGSLSSASTNRISVTIPIAIKVATTTPTLFASFAKHVTDSAGPDTSTAPNITLPGSLLTGDYAVLDVVYTATTVTIDTPAGWTLISNDNNSTNVRRVKFAKAVTAADSGQTVTWTLSVAGRWSVQGYIVRGSAQAIDALGVNSATSETWGTLVPVEPNCLALKVGHMRNGTTGNYRTQTTPPQDYTEQLDTVSAQTTAPVWSLVQNSQALAGMAGETQPSASGTMSGSINGSLFDFMTFAPAPPSVQVERWGFRI